MNQRIVIKTFGVLLAAGLIGGCVDHRPIRNGLVNESEYLEKTNLTGHEWLMKVTTVKASSPNIVAGWTFPGFESDAKLVRFKFVEDKLQLIDARKLQVDDPNNPNDDLATSTDTVVWEFPGKHVDIKLQESLDGERTNLLEENTEEDWQVRQYFKADFEGSNRDPLSAVVWYYADYLADCAQTTSVNLVPGSFDCDSNYDGACDENDNHMSFTLEVNYNANLLTYFSWCYDMVSLIQGVGDATIQYRFSFLQRDDTGTYEPELIAEKDPVNKKYGTFQHMNVFRDSETGLLSGNSLLHRWDPNRTEPVVYYFHEGFPERFKPMWQEIEAETNRVFEDAGAALRIHFAEWNEGGIERKLGDLRYSFVVWHQDIDMTMGLLGYGPSNADPRTGEIINGNVNLYNIGLDYYRYRIQDYLEFHGAEGKPADMEWEEMECAPGDTRSMAAIEQRTSATLWGEMRRIMELPDSTGTPGVDPTQDFIPEPTRDQFPDDYHRILPELRYVDPLWNPYVWRTADGYMPMSDFPERMRIEHEFMENMTAIQMNENPFGPVGLHGREGIEKQNDFIEQFRVWRKNHEQLQTERDLLLASRNIYVYDDNSAFNAISNGARRCVDYDVVAPDQASEMGCGKPCYRWESDHLYSERIIENVVTDVAIHELGHTLSLRHNFYGSVDAKHMREANERFPAEITASVMDYVWSPEATGHHRSWGLYDEAALSWIYGTPEVRDSVMQEDFLYCTDEHRSVSPLCTAHDLGITPSQIVLNSIERYDWQYETRNKRAYRTFWDTSSYIGSIYGAIFPMQRMWYMSIFDWGGGGVQDILKRLDQVDPSREVLTDPEYDEIAMDFYNDAIAANALIQGFYGAVITQPATFRNYQTEFDPYYGDVLRLGIINDKLFTTFAFMDFQEVWNYNPNIYTYVSMYDAPFGTRNWALSQRVLDTMLGGNYDTFAWFKYLSLNIFAYVTNTNLVSGTELKERIAIRRFENTAEFEDVYGTDHWAEINASNNPAQIFLHEGEEYIYSYVDDRNWHLVARKARSPVSFQYMRDYNESLNAGASTDLDNYGLKILLAYYDYYNTFQGF